jgi:hypothetical protein
MFRYSIDSYIAFEQEEAAKKLIEGLAKKCTMQISPELEKAFDDCKVNSYSYLEAVQQMAMKCGEEMVIVAIRRDNHAADSAQWDLKKGFDKLAKSWKDTVPYIEHSFNEDYQCPYGPMMMHAFFFFFTKYHDYEGSRDCMLYYLNKFYNLRAFA